eukprot:4546802-Pleurochrysis_carterae.AAC.1
MEPMNSTGRVTPLATFTRMYVLRCVMRSVGKRLRSPLAVRVEPLFMSATREPPILRGRIAELAAALV